MHPLAVTYFRELQDRICANIERVDGGTHFREDSWEREGGGGGRSRILENSTIFEKAGVNFSEVFGEMDAAFANHLPGEGTRFTATGISLVLHPRSPHIPTVHANFRFLTRGSASWFGGGADLTPYYPVLEDVTHFHRTWKAVCDRHANLANYDKMKRDCDEYFHLKHRNEARGVGGFFFDYTGADRLDATFAFVKDAGEAFVSSYVPIVERRKSLAWTAEQRLFQEYRRGRYVEFNLVYDRGTIFGLKTNGRTESILMSLPPVVRYIYDYQPAAGSPEAELTDYWLKPKDWTSM